MKNILKNRYWYLWFALALTVFSLIVIFFWKINLWIDMTGWTQSEYSYTWTIDIAKINSEIESFSKEFNTKNNNVINSTSAYNITWEEKIWVVIWFESKLDEKSLEKVKTEFKEEVTKVLEKNNQSFVLYNYTNIWKSFWDYIQKTAYITLTLAIICITLYIWFAFKHVVNWISSFSFSLITLVTLLHDVSVALWLYIFTSMFFPEFKLDTYSITAILTILWYSINDTIVVFDRIRTNLRQFWWKTKDTGLYEIVDKSLSETFTRSIFTSSTVIFVLIAIFFAWPEALKWFILVMIYGTVFGTYSSIFIASPLLYEVNKNNKIEVYKKVVVKDEDKVIV